MLTTYDRIMREYRSAWHEAPGSMAAFKPCDSPFCGVCRMVGESMHDFGRAMQDRQYINPARVHVTSQYNVTGVDHV